MRKRSRKLIGDVNCGGVALLPRIDNLTSNAGETPMEPNATLARHNVKITGVPGAPVVMFAHGFGCDQNMWRFVAPRFTDRFRVLCFDHIGAGRSDRSAYDSARHGTLRGYAADIIALCDDLEVSRIHFVGHSVSAMIGGLAAIARPDLFASLIMVGPSPRYLNDGDYVGGFSEPDMTRMLDLLDSNYLGWSSTMAPAIMGNADRPELAEELTNSFCQADPEIARRFARVTFLSDNRQDLPRITTRTLILQCSDDVVAGDQVGAYVHRAIAGSDFVKLRATGHCPNLSHPDEVTEAIEAFLSRVS